MDPAPCSFVTPQNAMHCPSTVQGPWQPGARAGAATLACQHSPHRTQKLGKVTSRIWQYHTPIFPTPPEKFSLARSQLPNALRGATSSHGELKTSLWRGSLVLGRPHGLPKSTSPGTKQGQAHSVKTAPRSYHRQGVQYILVPQPTADRDKNIKVGY
eukprot:gene10978-biopygen10873